MPTYDYQCENGHHFEIFQKMTDPKLEICPQCGGRVERLIGPGAGLVFKGSGFYSTDYRSETYRRAAKSETGGGGAAESSARSEPPAGGATAAKPEKTAKPEQSPRPPAKPAGGESAKSPGQTGGSTGGTDTAGGGKKD